MPINSRIYHTFSIACLLILLLAPLDLASTTPYERLNTVYRNMARAMGLGAARPVLVLDSTQTKYVAYVATREGRKVIGVEKHAYDICRKFGDRMDDALALLIGHELVHYTYGHSWGGEFASSFALSEAAQDVSKAAVLLDSVPYWETQADHIGGFYCYMAGYNIDGLSDTLLQLIYQEYKLTNKPKYPTLEERIAISNSNTEEIRKLILVFEAANQALFLEEYALARDFYMHLVSSNFGNREVFNNIGVSFILEAIGLMKPGALQFAYPVELELESRASKLVTKGLGEEIEQLLNNAVEVLDEAIQRDPEFGSAYVNKACVYSMLGDMRKAKFYTEEAIKVAFEQHEPNTLANAYTVLGIIHAQNGQKKQAKRFLKKAKKLGSWLAEKNLEILKGAKLKEVDWEGKPVLFDLTERGQQVIESAIEAREIIGEVDLYNQSLELTFYSQTIGNAALLFSDLPQSTVYAIRIGRNQQVFIQRTKPGYTGRSLLGIEHNSDAQDVVDAYGIPYKIYAVRQGRIFFYKKSKIAFVINELNKVEGWSIMRAEKW